MLVLARRKWWLMLVVLVADLVIALFLADTVIAWELRQLREAWHGE